jgi:hypothetical protein
MHTATEIDQDLDELRFQSNMSNAAALSAMLKSFLCKSQGSMKAQALHCTALYCTALHCTASAGLDSPALRCIIHGCTSGATESITLPSSLYSGCWCVISQELPNGSAHSC